jgi:peptide/nickel transport system ATP-binding protein
VGEHAVSAARAETLAAAAGGELARELISPSSDPLVSVRDLHVTFERKGRPLPALRGVSIDIAPGEIVGLVGESGSGKSVLGLALLGLLAGDPAPKVTGSAVVAGLDVVAASPEERRHLRRDHLGAVFQDPMTSLNPTMRVGRQVAEATGSADEAERLLGAVGVPEPARRMQAYPHELSGGLRQRVMIAMAISGNPALVIADEPTTALDVTVQAQILELMRRLCDETGSSFLFVTHDLGVAAQIADRIAVLYGGRIAELGTSDDVLSRPAHPYTVGLLESRLTMKSIRERPLETLPGEPPDPRDHPPGCPFAPRCSRRIDACDEALPDLRPAPTHPGAVACIRAGEPAAAQEQLASPVAAWPEQEIATTDTFAVRLLDVHKTFVTRAGFRKHTELQALRGIDLDVHPSEAVALVGESGCGKSTLLRVAAGLLKPDAGEVKLGAGGRPQIVFQDAGASLTPWMHIGDLVGERLREEGCSRFERKRRVADALALVGLPAEVAQAKPAQLSGGQRQRAAVARAIVVPPEVLLCDEPTSALDVSLAATVLNLIGRLRRELGMAVVFVTHDLAAARVVANRIAVMYLGAIIESGPADELTSKPAHPYTKALLAAVPAAGAVHLPLQGDPASPLDPPAGCCFHTRCTVARAECSADVPQSVTFGEHHERAASCVLVESS